MSDDNQEAFWNILLSDGAFEPTLAGVKRKLMEENSRRWSAYGPRGSCGHGLAPDAAVELYKNTAVEGWVG